MSTIFTRIYQGELPGFVIAETSKSFAVLNRYPAQPGHILAMPKQEVGYLFDLPVEDYQDLMELTRKVAISLKATTNANKIGIAVEGFGVKDHAHVHLIPINSSADLDTSMAPEASDEELKQMAEQFSRHWASAQGESLL